MNKYLELLLTDNSHLQTQLLRAFDSETISLKPILWLIARIYKNNNKRRIQIIEHLRAFKKDKHVKRESSVTVSSINLSSTFIRQSSIVADDAHIVSNSNAFNDPSVISQLANQSVKVRQSIYTDRSTAKEKIESDRLFASRIGELMQRDAEAIGELVSKTSILDYDEALELLGLPRTDESSLDRLSKEIERLGINIDLMDSFTNHGIRVFLANKTTTALIIKYLEHIRANFNDLLNDDNSQLTKAVLAARDYFYFSNVLQKFPTNIREEGERHSNTLSFDYAKLGDLVGVSND